MQAPFSAHSGGSCAVLWTTAVASSRRPPLPPPLTLYRGTPEGLLLLHDGPRPSPLIILYRGTPQGLLLLKNGPRPLYSRLRYPR